MCVAWLAPPNKNMRNIIKSYTHEIKYQVGQRVRVDIPEIPPEQTNCKTGVVTGIKTRFPKSPELRQHSYTVRFDEYVIIPEFIMFGQIHQLSVSAEQLELLSEEG